LAVPKDVVCAVLHEGRAYVWLSWFGTSLLLGLSFLALGLAGPGLVRPPGGAASAGVAYTLSMPVTRRQWAGVRMATGILELGAAATVASLAVSILSRTQAEAFPVGAALAHAVLSFVGAVALYGVFTLLSATLGEAGKAILGGAFLFLYGMFTFLIDGFRRASVFRLMTGDTYFLRGEVPWTGLAACVVLAALTLSASLALVERRDF
jgi:ABC-type transport system involved in multi-copper enzyme maturation permease subunit